MKTLFHSLFALAVLTVTAIAAPDASTHTRPPDRILVTGRASLIPADALFLFPRAREHLLPLARLNQGLGDFYAFLRPELNRNPEFLQTGSLEAIAAIRPDLVILKGDSEHPLAAQLHDLGISCLPLMLESPEDWQREIPLLGRHLGEPERATDLLRLFDLRLQTIRDALTALPVDSPSPRVLLLQVSAADGVFSFSVPPDSWMQTRLVKMAGGIPLWKGTGLPGSGWNRISFEQIAAWDPDRILLVSFKAPPAPLLAALRADPRWQHLRAVREGHLQNAPADLLAYAQPVSRWILFLQWLAANLHPDAFPAFNMETEIRAFYRDFFNVREEAILQTLLEAYHRSQPPAP